MKSLAQLIFVASTLGTYLVSLSNASVCFSLVPNCCIIPVISDHVLSFPAHSRMKTRDQVWYFFGRKENKYGKGDRQIRKTKSGFWKKTGVTMDIMRKTGDREKIGEKRVLVFKNHGGSKSDWAMHEYHATFSSPNQVIFRFSCLGFFNLLLLLFLP